MKLIRNFNQLEKEKLTASVVTIGKYDGVHRGHINIIKKVVADAKKLNCPSIVVTFEPEPAEFIHDKEHLGRIIRLREKLICFEEAGVDYVLCLRFNKELLELPPEQFITEILVKQLKIKEIIIGDDFRFGKGGRGNEKLLKAIGREKGFSVFTAKPLMIGKERVSSTNIRKFLHDGDLEKTALFLGRNYFLSGKIIEGDKRGRTMGVRTANIRMPFYRLVLQGIFIVRLTGIKDYPLYGIANLGPLPTFKIWRTRLEVHIFDFHENIYRKNVRIEFLHKLRDTTQFDSDNDLKQQINKDITEARKYLAQKQLV
ncbi:MAG: bifunctional riboflavin kinase/FAD synthetase [Victivallales bacterium]|nr:bifunctional riboflavin kinase/FAD synthetase [Victivallales bacterium]MCF7889238.1 bifunctional riboflavin kinase/FAD synthetase [Victivallales bacterium]